MASRAKSIVKKAVKKLTTQKTPAVAKTRKSLPPKKNPKSKPIAKQTQKPATPINKPRHWTPIESPSPAATPKPFAPPRTEAPLPQRATIQRRPRARVLPSRMVTPSVGSRVYAGTKNFFTSAFVCMTVIVGSSAILWLNRELTAAVGRDISRKLESKMEMGHSLLEKKFDNLVTDTHK